MPSLETSKFSLYFSGSCICVHVLLKSIVQDNECIQVMRGALNCICVHVLLKSIVQDNECIQVMRGALNDSNKRLPKDY